MEIRMKSLEIVASENKADIIQTKDQIHNIRVQPAVPGSNGYAAAAQNTPWTSSFPPIRTTSEKSTIATEKPVIKDTTVTEINGRGQISRPTNQSQGRNKKTVNAENMTSIWSDSEGYTLPREQRKKIIRQNRPKYKAVVSGTGSNGRVKGGPPPMRDFFVYRVDTDTTEDDIKFLLDEKNIMFTKILRASKPGSMFHSFRLTVPVTEQDKVMDPSTWPMGIQVRRFYVKRNVDRERYEDAEGDETDSTK
jgi:hypothetical protein